MANIDNIIRNFKNNRSIPLGLTLARNGIPGVSFGIQSARVEGINGVESSIWSGGPSKYNFLDIPQTMTISSSSAQDLATGTGVFVILISGYVDDYTPNEEIIILDGQNPVMTTANWIHISTMIAINVGSGAPTIGGSNDGDIYLGDGNVNNGIPETIFSKMNSGQGISQHAVICTPKNTTAYPLKLSFFAGKSDTGFARLLVTPTGGVSVVAPFSAELAEYQTTLDLSDTLVPFSTGSRLEAVATSSQSSLKVTATISALLVNEEVISKL